MSQLILYTTSHCHLCEQAEALLLSLKHAYSLDWQAIEIADDDELMTKYGTTIPVIKISNSNAELNWPFTKEAIINFIRQH